MDYNFNIHRTGAVLPQELQTRLLAWIKTLPLGGTTGFTPFGTSTFWEAVPDKFPEHPIIAEFQSFLESSVFFSPISLRSAEVNILGVNDKLSWHTDGQNFKIWSPIVCLRHRVHVYLQGEALIEHKRDIDGPVIAVGSPPPGEVMLFNDYIWHRVSTTSSVPRILLSAQVWDREWKHKRGLYVRNGWPTTAGY